MNAENPSNAAISLNPANGEILAEYPFDTDEAVESMLETASRAFRAWSRSRVEERTAFLRRLAIVLRGDADRIARLATAEMGKPIAQSRSEIEKCASACEWYAEHGPAFLADAATPVGKDAYVSYLPIGPVLGVLPWNFPFWQILRGAIPVLLGGNGYVLKHAPNVMGCAYLMRAAMAEAGLPEGVFSILNITPRQVSGVIADRRVAAVTVTGSVRAGAAIAAQAGAAIKKSVLELGGSDPFIVLADADLDRAAEAAAISRFQNTGQVCIAAKRIIVEAPVAEEFSRRFVAAVERLRLGNPLDEATYLGPMARYDLRDELDRQVRQGIGEGARLLLGGEREGGAGNYYKATVLADVRPGMTVFEQEIFGPVACLVRADDADDAIVLANRSDFGLAGALWTRRVGQAREMARRLETGGVFINGIAASDPRVPMGGTKHSGYGRELSSWGVHEFMNAQTVWVHKK
ncbi:aldehyde dehydrogenase family protein [Pigmentiphaga soli]|uniref:Aldehyde dehydrogenase family protein n=1 Tax=Pigmentiphaga soli TaxID=1007095 RepID=A0ABP8HIC2_9BURK